MPLAIHITPSPSSSPGKLAARQSSKEAVQPRSLERVLFGVAYVPGFVSLLVVFYKHFINAATC